MSQEFYSQEELLIFLSSCSDEGNEELNFHDSKFMFNVNFHEIIQKFESTVIFKKVRFERKVSFDNVIFMKEVKFENCYFSEAVTFQKTIFNEKVSFTNFYQNVSFKSAEFNSLVSFPEIFQNEIDLSFSKFKEDLNLSNRRFDQELHINNSTFLGSLNFKNTTFKKKVNAWNLTVNSDFTCKWANFREKLNLTDSFISKGKTDFFGTNFENNAYFYNTNFKRIDLKNSVIEKSVYFLGSKIKKSNRETNRIIKNHFVKQNNRIESLKFHQKEMSSYIGELLADSFNNIKKIRVWKFLKNIGDLTILILNFLSNGFGLWWFMGIIFTLTTTLIVFDYYLQSLNLIIDYNKIEYWKSYVQFILPTHKFDFMNITQLPDESYIIDYLGRIVSAFGIYQTVQAFRKFGKI